MNFRNLELDSIRPERFFLIIAFVYGLLFLIITPPFQSPDEVAHFYRAYQISEGKLASIQQDDRLGGYIPTSIITCVDAALPIFANIDTKADVDVIIDGLTAPLNPEKSKFRDYPNAAVYSPISYLPQSIAIASARILHLPPLLVFYSGRLISLLFWLFCIYLAIKIIPIYKWLFVLLALLPMSIFTNMSMSADVVTNSLAFLLISYYLYLSFSKTAMTRREYIYALGLALVLTSAKFVYAPLIVLFLLIPTKQFGSWKNRITKIGILFIFAGLTSIFWSWMMSSLYIDYDHYNPDYRAGANLVFGANIGDQVAYILGHGTYIFKVIYDSIIESFSMFTHGYIGTFGWLDSKLPVGLIWISYLVIFIISIADGTKSIVISARQKSIILLGFIFLFLLMFLMQNLAWGAVGSLIISNLQGRYFIPLFPLFFLLFYSRKYTLGRILMPLIGLFSIVLLTWSAGVIYSRYYIPTEYDEIRIACDAETYSSSTGFKTSNSNYSLKGADRSREKYFEGNSSVMLTPANPFGVIFELKDATLGDKLYVETMAQGIGAEVIISVQPKLIFMNARNAVHDSITPWSKLTRFYVVTEDMANQKFTVYLYNPSPTDTVYYDNILFIHNKIK